MNVAEQTVKMVIDFMKKAIFILVAALILSACSSNKAEVAQIDQSEKTFSGGINEIDGQSAIVHVSEGDVSQDGRVLVDLSVNEEQQFRAGDRVEVRFDGVVQESDPMQIKTVFVELVK